MVQSIFPRLDLDLKYLQAELARLDVRLQRQVRRWRLAGQQPADTFRGMYISDAEIDQLLTRSLSSNWGQSVALPLQEVQRYAEAEQLLTQHIEAMATQADQAGYILRLRRLASDFSLDRFEIDILLVCLAPVLDLRYERVYGYLQDDATRKRPSVNLILDLLIEPDPERLLRLTYFDSEATLFKYRFLKSTADTTPGLLSQPLILDNTIVAWLLGDYRPYTELKTHAQLHLPQADETNSLLTAQIWSPLKLLLHRPGFLAFYGPDQASQDAAAKCCAVELNQPLLEVDLAGVIAAGLTPVQAVRLALRDARLTGALPYLKGWDACLIAAEGKVLPDVLAELYIYDDVVIVAGAQTWQPRNLNQQRPIRWVKFSLPSYPQRLSLWRHFLAGDRPTAANGHNLPDSNFESIVGDQFPEGIWEEELIGEVAALAGQFALTSGQIRDAVAAAMGAADQQDRPLQTEDLFAAARAYSNPHLADLTRKIAPRYTWLDLILPADQLAILREIVATVRGRPVVLDEWGVGQKLASSRGVTILFAGPPGTGKTMAAEVIAADLGLDLYKIDLSTVVSKYIGETEKNLEKIFNEAQSSNAILFFDEADAIFGKRSEVKDAHDRYANIEISYLLQRMEAYDGVTILATNLRSNLDEAFTRRLHFVVDFPFPEKEDRLLIWQTLFPPDLPRDPQLDFQLLADRFKLTGGNIRNIIVSAAYLAAADGRQVTMAHLLHGAGRELQKMGRLVGEADLQL